ncbi:hypothetical protein P2318_34475 [Myxococcaceae bacterium GXIMD 01537]
MSDSAQVALFRTQLKAGGSGATLLDFALCRLCVSFCVGFVQFAIVLGRANGPEELVPRANAGQAREATLSVVFIGVCIFSGGLKSTVEPWQDVVIGCKPAEEIGFNMLVQGGVVPTDNLRDANLDLKLGDALN